MQCIILDYRFWWHHVLAQVTALETCHFDVMKRASPILNLDKIYPVQKHHLVKRAANDNII